MADWREIWEMRGSVEVGDYELTTLIELDGFDSGAGKLTSAHFEQLADLAVRECELGPGSRLLDVGCGAGALLWCLRDTGCSLAGIDASRSLIEHARVAVPEAMLAVAEATAIPFQADAVVCHSVFQYFPDYAYAERVLAEFRRVAPIALVLDVPDLATREESERKRAELGSKPGEHLYYPRSFFQAARVWTNDLEGYGNGPYRFNAFLDFRTTGVLGAH